MVQRFSGKANWREVRGLKWGRWSRQHVGPSPYCIRMTTILWGWFEHNRRRTAAWSLQREISEQQDSSWQSNPSRANDRIWSRKMCQTPDTAYISLSPSSSVATYLLRKSTNGCETSKKLMDHLGSPQRRLYQISRADWKSAHSYVIKPN